MGKGMVVDRGWVDLLTLPGDALAVRGETRGSVAVAEATFKEYT
jgi:hypothetical protein